MTFFLYDYIIYSLNILSNTVECLTKFVKLTKINGDYVFLSKRGFTNDLEYNNIVKYQKPKVNKGLLKKTEKGTKVIKN